jgi:hypothetical protein
MGHPQGFVRLVTILTVVLGVTCLPFSGMGLSHCDTPVPPPLALQNGVLLAVIGVTQEENKLRGTEKKKLGDRRMGFGLTQMLAELLFETGKFRLLEEKDLRQRELLDNLVTTYWGETGAQYSAQLLRGVAIQLGVALLAYAGISHSRSSGSSIQVGPFSRHTHTLQVRVHVCLFAAASEAVLCQEGEGQAQQEAAGAFYEYRGDRLEVENNAAGRATKHAITQAVHALVRHIQFSPE